MQMTMRRIQALMDVQRLVSRHRRVGIVDMDEEALSEEQFVRSFGTKVKKVRLSHRLDMVGLLIVGQFNGIWITRGEDSKRRVRAVDVDADGKIHVLNRVLVLNNKDSLSNLQRGLLNWVK